MRMLGRILRRIGESDDQAWLFMLAESTLQRLAGRIADDLPDDLAVLKEVQMPASTPISKTGLIETVGNIGGQDNSIGSGTCHPIGLGAANIVSLGGLEAKPSYQVSFSQHYRQLLLACF